MKNKNSLFIETRYLAVSALLGLLALAPLNSQASYFIACGEGLEADSNEFKKEVLAISSEDDKFTGPAGKNWSFRLNGGEWNKKSQAKIKYSERTETLTLLIPVGQSPSGPVGTEYVISAAYSESTTLEVYSVGGFVGRQKTATFPCVTSLD